MEDKLKKIGFYTLEDSRAKCASFKTDLWRCELIITNKCNFKCPYCRGTDSSANISFDDAKKTVNLWGENGLRNIRFSGGEPTMVSWLPDIISYSKKIIKNRIAISTNGSADKKVYKQLLKSGANDFSISLDACCASTGDIMAGTKGVWKTVVSNIEYLSSKSYVTVGVVLTDRNISEVESIIKFAINLGVSDVRIITAAQWDKSVEINLSDINIDNYPILKYRLNNIKNNRPMRGISKNDNKFCPLILDDMAVKGKYHYPCIIKMREGCEPIGEIGANMREERKYYYLNHNTYLDKICRYNCLDVCVDYNNRFMEFEKSNLQ